MRQIAALTVALFLVTAGCSAFPSGDAATVETTSDADETTAAQTTGTTAEPTTEATASDADLPPGLSASGVTDAEAFAAAHAAALANRSYAYDREATVVASNGTELGRWSQHVQVGADRAEFNFTQRATGVTVTGVSIDDTRTYTNGSVTFSNASVFRDGYRRTAGHGFAESQFDGEQSLARAFDAAETSVEEVERNGATWYRVRARNGSETLTVRGANGTVEIAATDVTATALVAPSGLVRNVTYEYDFERGGVAGHHTRTVEYSAVGETTVERPAWVADAEETLANRLAPGLNEGGVTDPWKLADAHRAALNDTSYTVTTNLTARENGTVLARSNSTVKVAAGGLPVVSRNEVGGERPGAISLLGHGFEVWVDENQSLYAMEEPNGTTYQRAAAESRPPVHPEGRDHLYLLFVGLDTTVTGTETRDGTTLYRVNSTGVADADVLADELRTETVENASLSALVTEDGLVREYRVEYAGTVGNDTVRIERTTRFTGLGETTVERPPWYDEAVNATDE